MVVDVCVKDFALKSSALRRNTQTKGVWLWGKPDIVSQGPEGVTTAIIYVDTEGFESTGKSDAYDDRIFALSAIISSLLVIP